jgi:hypothetical protein
VVLAEREVLCLVPSPFLLSFACKENPLHVFFVALGGALRFPLYEHNALLERWSAHLKKGSPHSQKQTFHWSRKFSDILDILVKVLSPFFLRRRFMT